MIKMSIESEIRSSAQNMRRVLGRSIDENARRITRGSPFRSLIFGNINISQYIDVRRSMKEIEKYDLLVGIPERNDKRQKGAEDGITNAQLAYIHTHGVDKKSVRQNIQRFRQQGMNFSGARQKAHQMYIMTNGSPVYHIPPRPIIEPAIEANKEKIMQKMQKALDAFLSNDFTKGEQKLKEAGMFAQNKVRAWFTDTRNGWPPNSPYTIKKKKGKENPLIDTGELRKSITYVVSKKD